MSAQDSVDSTNFELASMPKDSLPDVPYLKKELAYIVDNNNSTNYSRNQVEFHTKSLAGNKSWADPRNAFMSIPIVVKVVRDDPCTAADAIQMIKFKSGNHNIIDSSTFQFSEKTITEAQPKLGAYLSFKQHSEWSMNDAVLNSHTGYRKDSNDWQYSDDHGLVNNAVESGDYKTFVDHSEGSKHSILNASAVRDSGVNYYEMGPVNMNGATPPQPTLIAGQLASHTHYFMYDCMVRLKDLLFFEKMDLVRYADMKLNFRINQSDTTITNNGGELTVDNVLKGSTNFVIRTDHLTVADGKSEYISLRVCENGLKHVKQQCRLYLPLYELEPDAQSRYLSIGSKKILYNDVYYTLIKAGAATSVSAIVSNSQSRVRRLIIVPMLSEHKNAAGVVIPAPDESVLSTEPSTASPCFLKNFNIQVGNKNHYAEDMEFKYMNYLHELNGNFAINHNQSTGASASLINQRDFNANYGYIVVDLSRKYSSDEMLPLNIQLKAQNVTSKALDLHCYLEYSRDLQYSISTGQKED
jgi:hypothetical protein